MRTKRSEAGIPAEKLTAAYDTLVGIASGGGSLDAVLGAASRLMQCGLAYVNPRGDIVSTAGGDADFREKVRFLPTIEMQRLYHVVSNQEGESGTGHIVIQHLAPAAEALLAPLQLAVHVYFNVRNTKSKRILQYAEKFLDKLPDGIEVHDLEHYFRIMKVDFGAGILVITGAITGEAAKGGHFFERLDARLRNYSRKYISRVSEEPGRQYIAAISPPNPSDLWSFTRNLAEICSHEAARHYGEKEPEVRIAMGRARENQMEIRECSREAIMTLRLSSYVAPARCVTSWDELGAYKLISRVSTDEYAATFCRETLKGLAAARSRENDELMETLAFLDESNWNLREVSRKMFYHHNTIKHRYARIQDILEADLADAETRFRISLALRIRRCMPRAEDRK